MATVVTNLDIDVLDEYLTKKGVDYVLTGTAALYFHGALPKDYDAHDIDIIVITTPENRDIFRAMFGELQTLAGCEYDTEHYEDQVFIFKIGPNNVKVNVFEAPQEGTVSFRIMRIDSRFIKVHDVKDVLKAKFKMGRPKDHQFCIKMFNQICAMFPCSKK